MRLLLLLFSLFTLKCFSQNFEGKITYTSTYKSKAANLKDEQLNTFMGTTQDYYIKDDEYKTLTNGLFLKMQLYNSSENRVYVLTGKTDTLYWDDCAINKDAATSFEIKKGSDTVMGIPCDLLVVYTPKSTTYYYYSEKYPVDPSLYKTHAYGNWYYMISKVRALPLKIVYEGERFSLTSTAVSIIPEKLDAKTFEIPDKSKTAPSSW